MGKVTAFAFAVALSVVVSSTLVGGKALAQGGPPGGPPGQVGSVCYFWDIFPNSPLRLDVQEHSPLTTRDELREFGHALQTAFNVHGKGVGPCGPVDITMAAAHGTVVVAEKNGNPETSGAHMGLQVDSVRGDGISFDFCRPYQLDCTSDESSPTPGTWFCESRNEFDVYHGASTLKLIDPLQFDRCSTFEDSPGDTGGANLNALEAGEISGPGLPNQ